MSTIEERSTRLVNLGDFSGAGSPERIESLDLSCPVDNQYILRMAVRVDGHKMFILPDELEWVEPMLKMADSHQRDIDIDHPFCYITVRHGIVSSQTDDEWHVDGFSTKVPHITEQNYIWCSDSGTEFIPTDVTFPIDFDPLKHNVNLYLKKFVKDYYICRCEDKTVYCQDPYILHRRPTCTDGTMRTFVRISFVPIEINDINNTQNPLLSRSYTDDGVCLQEQVGSLWVDGTHERSNEHTEISVRRKPQPLLIS